MKCFVHTSNRTRELKAPLPVNVKEFSGDNSPTDLFGPHWEWEFSTLEELLGLMRTQQKDLVLYFEEVDGEERLFVEIYNDYRE